MRTALLLFFYAALAGGLFWAAGAWARTAVRGHYTAAGVRYSDHPDPRIARQVDLAAGRAGEGEGLAFFAEYHDVLTEAERITKEAAPHD